MFSAFLSSENLHMPDQPFETIPNVWPCIYSVYSFTCVITFFVKRSIDKVNPVIFGVKTDAGDGCHYNCHTKGNRCEKHDDMMGLRKISIKVWHRKNQSKLALSLWLYCEFVGLVMWGSVGLVGLIDAKGINVTQHIWPSGCPTLAQKRAKTAFFVFLALIWSYVRQPDGHINWVTLMPFASINSTNPRNNL